MALSGADYVVSRLVFIYVLAASCSLLYFALFPCWAVLRPLDRGVYYKALRVAMAAWCINFAALAERWSPVRLHIYGELPPPDKSILVFSNHRCNLDWVYVWSVALRVGALQAGYFNAVAKSVLRKIPIWGWAFKLVGFLFLKRNFDQDIGHIQGWIRGLADSKRVCWLVLYPEGTRYTAENKAKSDAVAEKLGLEKFEGELLLPRTKGFVTLVQGLRNKLYGVLDMTIVYTGPDGSLLPWTALGTNALWEVFGRKAPVADAHIHLKLHRSELLPEGEEELKKWCMLRWKEKQELLKSFVKDGQFPIGYHGVNRSAFPARLHALLTLVFLASGLGFVYLAVSSYLFRAYLLWSTVVLVVVALADSPTSTI